MWTGKDTLRALRGQKGRIRDAWLTEAQAQLWHLDRPIFARRGALIKCVSDTLTTLMYAYERHCQHTLPSPDESTPISQNPPVSSPTEILNTLNESESVWQDCAEQWAMQPLPWADIRALNRLLTVCVCQNLTMQGADTHTLGIITGLLTTQATITAEIRLQELETQTDARREESIINQQLAGRFLANASHELRTPLTAVLGFSDLLLEETYGALSEAQRTAIGHIENSAQNLLEIVNNLLDLLKVRAGELRLFYRQVAIVPLLQELHKILTPLAERKKVKFDMLPGDSVGVIEADENIVRHIVYHLLTSSLRATPAEGVVELSAVRSTDSVCIYIRDTALHLPHEALVNTADPFPRLENSPTRGYEGWEVGLPLVRRYIDLHGGKLEIESAPDKGTTFWVILNLTASVQKEDRRMSTLI